MPRQILHIDLDAFFVSVERALDPSLRGRPVVVGGKANSRGVVACASYEARAYGLRAGTPLTTAYRLCPQAVFLPGRFANYVSTSERFLDILRSFTPDVEALGLDEAFMDLTGFEPLYGPVKDAAVRIKEAVNRELDVTASVGIAPCKVVAKVASDLCKPDGLLEVAPGEEGGFLAPLPIRMLPGVGSKAEKALKDIGVSTIGQLASLPLSATRRLFGVGGYWLPLWANGVDDSHFQESAPPKSISRETTFPQDTADRRFLRGVLRYLGERVGSSLREDGRMARRVVLKVRYADFETVTRHRTLERATNADDIIFGQGLHLLERELDRKRQRVRLLGIGVSNLTAYGGQLSLLDATPSKSIRLNKATDGIRRKYGFTSIQRGLTLQLEDFFVRERDSYVLKTPSLSR
ncbi:MAG: DNA polymerase IV [Dehalococcoidia bacterium]